MATAIPLPKPPMDRAALLAAVAEARSAAAAGLDDRQAQEPLDGKEFELRIRFGCGGPTDAKTRPLGWSVDEKGGVLRIHATPDVTKNDPAVAQMAVGDVESVEGFWLPRPWLLQASCPVNGPAAPAEKPPGKPNMATAAPQPAAPALKVGIAQFFTANDPRTARRDERPYEVVEKLDPSTRVGEQGFELVLSGRLRALDGGRVIRCVATAADAPPSCLISASFDHVWIEDAASKERIADWSSS
jgi:hypothetical protein